MELLYIYIDSFRCFQQTEFNFRADMKFRYEKGYVRQMPSREKLSNEFWGENISNLNVIVGNNGAGKTSLMQWIIGMMTDVAYDRMASIKEIMILLDKEEIILYDAGCGVKKLVLLEGTKWKWKKYSQDELREKFSKYKLMYLTNALTNSDYRRGKRRLQNPGGGKMDFFYDCSVGNLIVTNAMRNDSDLNEYFYYELYKQVKFVYDRNQNKIIEEMLKMGYPVPKPKRLYIELILNHFKYMQERAKTEIEKYISECSIFNGELEKIKLITNGERNKEGHVQYEILSYLLCTGCIYSAIDNIVQYLSENKLREYIQILQEKVKEKRNPCNGRDINYFELIRCVWIAYDDVTEDDVFDINQTVESYDNFILMAQKTDVLMDHFEIETPYDYYDLTDDYPHVLPYRISITTDDTRNSEWLIEFLQKYRYVCIPNYFLNFTWGLSSGESSLLSLFASFYYIFNYDFSSGRYGEPYFENIWGVKKVRCDSLLILIDEADLSYHLEWQKQYVSILTTFLQKEYSNMCCSEIQIILSTHSPLLLSDIPEQNVIYLRYDADTHRVRVDSDHSIGTFGQNVHMLMRDSFFLESGTMGNFADRKISSLVGRLNAIKKEIERIEIIQDKNNKTDALNRLATKDTLRQLEDDAALAKLIAEPIISRKLMDTIQDLRQKLWPLYPNELDLSKYTNEELLKLYERIRRQLKEL